MISKERKFRVNHQMEDVILLDRALEVTIFEQKDFIDNIFISENDHCTNSSREGKS